MMLTLNRPTRLVPRFKHWSPDFVSYGEWLAASPNARAAMNCALDLHERNRVTVERVDQRLSKEVS